MVDFERRLVLRFVMLVEADFGRPRVFVAVPVALRVPLDD